MKYTISKDLQQELENSISRAIEKMNELTIRCDMLEQENEKLRDIIRSYISHTHSPFMAPVTPAPSSEKKYGCSVCGISGINGYVCQRSDCPTGVSCTYSE